MSWRSPRSSTAPRPIRCCSASGHRRAGYRCRWWRRLRSGRRWFHWDSWFDALLYTPKRAQIVLQLLLRRILIEHQASNLFDLSVDEIESGFVAETIKAATLYVAIGPIILLYPFLQRYFVKGIMTGSLKG